MQIICPSCKARFFFKDKNLTMVSVKCYNCYHIWDVSIDNNDKDEMQSNQKKIINGLPDTNNLDPIFDENNYFNQKKSVIFPSDSSSDNKLLKKASNKYRYIKILLFIFAIIAVVFAGIFEYQKYLYISECIQIKDIKSTKLDNNSLIVRYQIQNISNQNASLSSLAISLLDNDGRILDVKTYKIDLKVNSYTSINCSNPYKIDTDIAFSRIEIKCK